MREVYRKRGSIVRYENGTLLRVREAGQAVDDGGVFRCAPDPDAIPLPEIGVDPITNAVDRIQSFVTLPLTIERLIATDGRAEHQFGERSWSETHRRIHLSIAHGQQRVLIDEGSLVVADIDRIAAAFGRIGRERPAPARLRLAPRVMAALTPELVGTAPPNVHFEQIAGGNDGKGRPIAATSGPPWPNWYRPSYRVRPLRAALNAAVRCSVTAVEGGLPQAIALLAPANGLTMRLLCLDGDDVFPASVRIVRIDAVTEPTAWFPFGAGVWAGEAEVAT